MIADSRKSSSEIVLISFANMSVVDKTSTSDSDRAMSPAQSEDSGLAPERGTTYATITLPRDNTTNIGITLADDGYFSVDGVCWLLLIGFTCIVFCAVPLFGLAPTGSVLTVPRNAVIG
uniref:Uncharacterized protein n=1 Tax=Glossina austeni TaxID=7395 RepID=A0A1A9UVN5_GLOAU